MKTLFEMARNGERFSDVTVIDVHAHYGSLIQTYLPFNNAESIVENMDRIGVDATCFCAQPYGGFGDQHIWNARQAEAVRANPGRFYGYVTLNGNWKDQAMEEFEWGEQNGLTLGLKMHVSRQGYHTTDEFLYPIYEKMNARHAWYLHHHFGTEAELEQLLRDFPQIVFIQGHPGLHYERLVKQYPNMYMSTCAGLKYNGIEELVRHVGAEKLLMGSDSVIFDPTFGIGPVVFAKISEEEKRMILGENAKKLMAQIVPLNKATGGEAK